MSIASVEAQKQLDRIVALGYPDVADISAAAFRSLARPLIGALEHSDLGSNILLVPTRELVSPESLIARTSINRMAGFTTMPPRDIASFLPQDGFMPPEGPFYLVVNPHTGTCYVNREPYLAGQRVLHGPSRGESVPLKRFSSKDKVGKVDGDRPLSAHGEP